MSSRSHDICFTHASLSRTAKSNAIETLKLATREKNPRTVEHQQSYGYTEKIIIIKEKYSQ